MPYRWVEPELFLEYDGMKIYHTYGDDGFADSPKAYWYTTDVTEERGWEFDVRELKTGLTIDKDNFRESIRAILRKAIEMNLLKIPEGDE